MGKRYATNRKAEMVRALISNMQSGAEFTSRQVVEMLLDEDTKHYTPNTRFVGHVLSRMSGVEKKGKHSIVWVKA